MGWKSRGGVEKGVKGKITNTEELSKSTYGNVLPQKHPNT